MSEQLSKAILRVKQESGPLVAAMFGAFWVGYLKAEIADSPTDHE
jgi:hypothetical protein